MASVLHTLGSLAVVCAVAYLGVGGTLFLAQRSLIYKPDRATPSPAASGLGDMAEVSLTTGDGLTLAAWHRPPDHAERPTVIFFHGNAGHRGYLAHKARAYLDAGYGLLLPDYRGYGGNPGRPSEQGLYADALAAHDYLRDHHGLTSAQMVYHGESLGSGVAAWLAEQRPPLGLILEAGYTSLPDVAGLSYPWLPTAVAVWDRFNTLERLPRLAQTPLLVLHGEQDRLIPATMGVALYEAYQGPKRLHLFPEGRHADLYHHGAAAVVLDWLRQQAASP